MSNPLFTVFTPTYNRAHTLERVYQSLRQQTLQNFEWLLIDDGSIDNTAEMVKGWQQRADFPIVYRYQVNAGKHIAFNHAVQIARGELFLPIDSDDGFLANSLEMMLYWWIQIPIELRSEYTGIVTLCQYADGSMCGPLFPASPLDTNALDLRYKYKMRAECWGFHRTDVLKQHPFPEDSQVRFIPENIVWDKIAHSYKIRCINEPLRIFYQDSGNQLTKADPRKKALVKDYFLQILNRDFAYFKDDPLAFAKMATLYIRYSLHLADQHFMQRSRFSHSGAFLLAWLLVPLGMIVFLADRHAASKLA